MLASLACGPPAPTSTPPRYTPEPSAAASPPPRISVETRTDEFTGAVSHTMEHPLASESHAPRGATFFALANNAGAVGILANISIPSDSWRYLECDRVDILADQARVEIDGSRRDDGRVFRGGAVIEHIRLEIPWASLVQMASAQEVRIRVCNDVYRGDATFTAALGELARRMYAAEPTAAGAP